FGRKEVSEEPRHIPEEEQVVVPEVTDVAASAKKDKTEHYYQQKRIVFSGLIETLEVSRLSQMEISQARGEIARYANEIISLRKIAISNVEQAELIDDITNDILGYGPLEPL